MKKPSTPRNKRRRSARTHARKAGLAPGVPVYTGDVSEADLRIHRLRYSAHLMEEAQGVSPEAGPGAAGFVTWLDAIGLQDAAAVSVMGKALGLHPLAIEDLLNPASHPKAEDFGDRLLLVIPMATPIAESPAGLPVDIETVSIVLGPGFVATFQERPGDVYDPIRRRLREGAVKIRSLNADYLFYSLLDAVVDGWFASLVGVEEQLDALEQQVVEDGDRLDHRQLHATRTEVASLRRSALALREAVGSLVRTRCALLGEEVQPYLRDLVDHSHEVVDLVDAVRDRAIGSRDLHLALENRRMNEIMRVLTIFSSVFLPLTFIVGVYGMNFQTMPELAMPWGYPAVLALMVAVSVGMLVFFRRKHWI